MPDMPLHQLPLHRLSERLAAGAVSSESVTRACLARIAERDGEIRAWAWIEAEPALAAARQRDGEARRGPLHGIPIGVKDIIDTADMPTRHGTPVHAENRPATDAACVALLREAGAVILGKTHTTELATFQPTVTTNPHDTSRTPGGSSSGSAAAVADHMVPAALGTQTWGSVIRPAGFCGVVGLKPGQGTVPRAGVKAQAETLDTVGCFSRSARDLPLLLAGMTGETEAAFTADAPAAPRIGICPGPGADAAAPETLAAMDRAEARFRAGGARIEHLSVPPAFEAAWAAQPVIAQFEMVRSFAAERRCALDLLSATLRARLETGQGFSRDRYHQALDSAGEARRVLAGIFAGVDLLLTPSQPGEAPAGLAATGDPHFNRFWTLVGNPTVTLPCLRGPNRMPVGIQLVAPLHGESRLLAAAIWAESCLAAPE